MTHKRIATIWLALAFAFGLLYLGPIVVGASHALPLHIHLALMLAFYGCLLVGLSTLFGGKQ